MADDYLTIRLPKAGGYKTFAAFGITATLGALAVAFPGHIPATTEQQVASGVDAFAGLLTFFLSTGGILLRLMTNSPPAGALNLFGLDHKPAPEQIVTARHEGYDNGYRAGRDLRRISHSPLERGAGLFPSPSGLGPMGTGAAHDPEIAARVQEHHAKLAAELEMRARTVPLATPRPDFRDLETQEEGFIPHSPAVSALVDERYAMLAEDMVRVANERLNADDGHSPLCDTHRGDHVCDCGCPTAYKSELELANEETDARIVRQQEKVTMHSRALVFAFLIPFLSPSLPVLGLAAFLSGCSTVQSFQSISEAETTGQKAFAAYGAWVALERASARVVTDSRVPAPVRRAVRQTVLAGHPIATATQQAARAVVAAQKAFQDGTGTQEALVASTRAASASVSRLETQTSALAVAVNAGGPVIPPAASVKDTFRGTN